MTDESFTPYTQEEADEALLDELLEEINDDRLTAFYSTLYYDDWIEIGPKQYLPTIVMSNIDAEAYPALFTEKEIERAVARASKNLEEFVGIEYAPYDPEILLLDTVELIDNLSIFQLVKIWAMKKMGIVTEDTIRRILDGPQDEAEDSKERCHADEVSDSN